MNRALRTALKAAISMAVDRLCPALCLARTAVVFVLALAVLIQYGRARRVKGDKS